MLFITVLAVTGHN